MQNVTLYVCLMVYSLSASLVNAKSYEQSDIVETFGQKHVVASKVLKEKRELLIHVPNSDGKPDAKFPVLYVLDGTRHFKHAVLATQHLIESGKMPHSIVVGISNNTGQRMRDSYDGRGNFLTFINKEVVPYVRENFQTSGMNVVFGHSAMGLVALSDHFASTSEMNKYIVSSAAFDLNDSTLFNQLKTQLNQDRHKDSWLYFSVGDKLREGQGFFVGAQKLAAELNRHRTEDSHWSFQHIKHHNHTSASYIALFNGLSYVFSDFEAPAISSYQAFVDYGELKQLKVFFAQRAEKYATAAKVPIDTITALAFTFYGEGKLDQAIALLEQHVEQFDNPTRLYGALGFIYENKQALAKAKSAYQQALAYAKKAKLNKQTQQYYQNKVSALKES